MAFGSQGVTEAERYLAGLCRRTFLSLWSYPNVTRDVFVPGTKIGKEVSDLLVIFEEKMQNKPRDTVQAANGPIKLPASLRGLAYFPDTLSDLLHDDVLRVLSESAEIAKV